MFRRKLNKISDEDLVEVIVKEKKHEHFGILYDRYSEKVYHKCISFVHDAELAQDLAHDVFLKTFVNLSKFESRSKFSTWLYSLTYNFCIDYLRKNNKYIMENDDQLHQFPDIDEEATERELLSMEALRLKKVLEIIPHADKMILLMKYQDELSIKDIMEGLNLSESAVKMRVKRAKLKALETYKELFKNEG
ncbi:MAG: RNA polymerase sigma factor [Flavobacteriales bacterium]